MSDSTPSRCDEPSGAGLDEARPDAGTDSHGAGLDDSIEHGDARTATGQASPGPKSSGTKGKRYQPL